MSNGKKWLSYMAFGVLSLTLLEFLARLLTTNRTIRNNILAIFSEEFTRIRQQQLATPGPLADAAMASLMTRIQQYQVAQKAIGDIEKDKNTTYSLMSSIWTSGRTLITSLVS
ncbi:MAG: hypothetical protein O7G85_05610 [Planctomycetota bacterium]|nr:hypothetical protein [Planctomycetota bacterium]